MKYVSSPNLPRDTKTVLIGKKYSELLKIPLENRGISVLEVPDNPDVDKRLASHADLSVLHLGENKLALAPYLKGSALADELEKMGFALSISQSLQGEKYPKDSTLNMCLCGKKLFYNPKTTDKRIVEYLTIDRGSEPIIVKQGYTKCSVCVVGENAIMTSDEGVHRRAVEAGLDSLKIGPGFIALYGYDYGFIGGSSFKINEKQLAFTGHLHEHPDKKRILNFLSLHNVEPVYITEQPIFDAGSVLQIVEK